MYSPDRQIIKLPFDQLIFAATALSLKPRGRMTTAITFSRQNDAGSSARTTQLSFSYVVFLVLGSKAISQQSHSVQHCFSTAHERNWYSGSKRQFIFEEALKEAHAWRKYRNVSKYNFSSILTEPHCKTEEEVKVNHRAYRVAIITL